MQKIPAYVINLERREDRLAHMSAHLKTRGVEFTRVDAVDYQSLSDAKKAQIEKEFANMHGESRAIPAVWCCIRSHMKAWQAFLESAADYALILEDDIHLSADMAQLLADDGWTKGCEKLIKLEQSYSKTFHIIGPPFAKLPVRRDLCKFESESHGGAAYIISREGARRALAFSGSAKIPLDHILFDSNRSALARCLRPSIILPCMAVQPDISDSDLSVSKPPRKRAKFLRIYDFIMRLLFRARRYSYRQFLIFFMNRRHIIPLFQEDMDVAEKPDKKEKP